MNIKEFVQSDVYPKYFGYTTKLEGYPNQFGYTTLYAIAPIRYMPFEEAKLSMYSNKIGEKMLKTKRNETT